MLVHCHMGINWDPSAECAVVDTDGGGSVEAIELIRRRSDIAVAELERQLTNG